MSSDFWIALTALATLGLLVVGVVGWFGPIGRAWRGRQRRSVPMLEAAPTGGPSPDIRLVVTNRDRKGDFHATATLTASRHDPNPLRQGSYALMWLGRGGSTIALDRGQSHALLIARWFEHPNIPTPPRMGEVRVIECNGSVEGEWDGFRWNFIPNQPLPEFDIDISIAGIGWTKPFRRSYTLRPANWIGPLELLERVPEGTSSPRQRQERG